MGNKKKERKLERERKALAKAIPKPYTKDERNKKVNAIFVQLMSICMEHTLTPEIKQAIFDFRDNGTPVHTELKLPEYSRTMIIHFENDKNKDSNNAITFNFDRIRVDDGTNDNPINRLNKLQEELLQQELSNLSNGA